MERPRFGGALFVQGQLSVQRVLLRLWFFRLVTLTTGNWLLPTL